jgi:hypothetical protein
MSIANDQVLKPKGALVAEWLYGVGFLFFLLSILAAWLASMQFEPGALRVGIAIGVLFSGFTSMLLFMGISAIIHNTAAILRRLDEKGRS